MKGQKHTDVILFTAYHRFISYCINEIHIPSINDTHPHISLHEFSTSIPLSREVSLLLMQ